MIAPGEGLLLISQGWVSPLVCVCAPRCLGTGANA